MSERKIQVASLSPEQEIVRDTWEQGLAVMAGAGSGKTTTLVAKCAKLIERNPKARFAAVSFTERSASDLRSKLSLRLLDLTGGNLNAHWITTIHGLCGSIIREYPREAGFDAEETVLSESESQTLWDRAIEAIWLEALPESVSAHLDILLNRENRDSLHDLLKRVRELSTFGVMEFLRNSEDDASRSLFRLSEFVLERYERLKKRQGAMDFNDLERGAERALTYPQVREAYHRRFDLVLVDEFQDTNPIQAKMIWQFARPDSSNLCVVGDPKQSIYRFRDADVSVFEEYCKKLPIQQSLTWNYRSLPGIIEYANAICEPIFKASELKFEALVPKRTMPKIKSSRESTVIRLDVRSPEDLGLWIQSQLDQGISLNDMALLVRRVRGNEKWIRALVSSGIPVAVGSGGFFWEDPRVRELVAFLKWWDNPGNALSGGIFLRAPWMGISDLLLDQWVKQDPTLIQPFLESSHPFAKKLKKLRKRILRPGELLMEILVHPEFEEELGVPLLGLWHRAEEFSSRGLDFHEVVLEFSNSMQQKRREREVPVPRNLGQLTLLTLHGSKGLEFPHVILIDFGDKPRASEAPLLFWDRKKGVYLGQRDGEGERDRKNTEESQWREIEKQKNLAESKRLFYVALTRARERLVLVCPELKSKNKDIDEGAYDSTKAWQEDYWRGWIDTGIGEYVLGTLPEKKLKKDILVEASTQMSFALPRGRVSPPSSNVMRARHSVTEWTLLSRCPRAYEWTYIRTPNESAARNISDEVAQEMGAADEMGKSELLKTDFVDREETQKDRDLGTRVHRYLERGDYATLEALEAEVGSERFRAKPVLEWARSTHWMLPADPQSRRDVWTELAFEVPLDGEILVGSVDRIVAEPLQENPSCLRYTIIDFKVTEKKKSLRTLQEAYQMQMELYAWALSVLEPSVCRDTISALIVNITADGVQTIYIPLGKLNLQNMIQTSLTIIEGTPGEPKPGFLCKYCEFARICPESKEI